MAEDPTADHGVAWDFDRNADAEGWDLVALGRDGAVSPAPRAPVIMGGSTWISLRPDEQDPTVLASIWFQVYGNVDAPVLALRSRPGLHLDGGSGRWRLVLRVLNLSPNTELVGMSRGTGEPWRVARRFGSLRPDVKQWQRVVIPLECDGTIDQVGIRFPSRARGDLWIDRIELVAGPPLPEPEQPRLAEPGSMPRISVPGLDQAGFADAFTVLDECMITDVPVAGLDRPVIAAGGVYQQPLLWFSLDGALALQGAKWVDPGFAEEGVRGFRGALAQNPDGRLDLYSAAIIRGQVADQASFPAILEVAYDVARRSSDLVLRAEVCDLMSRNLAWWCSPVKRDTASSGPCGTGLVAAVFEETFGEVPRHDQEAAEVVGSRPGEVAPVDLNVALALGCRRLARLYDSLGQHDQADGWRILAAELTTAIQTLLWDEDAGVFRSYDLTAGRRRDDQLSAATFDPLQLGLTEDRVAALTARLTDPAQFNWGRRPLTSIAMTDPRFEVAVGPYDGRAWFGDVWTFRNLPVIAGLRASGRADLAAELAWATITEFHANYCEFLDPTTGDGHGVQRYAWSAAQYVQAVVEHLFGVDVDAIDNVLRIAPLIPAELAGSELTLDGLVLPWPERPRLSLRITPSVDGTTLMITVDGPVPAWQLITTVGSRESSAPLRATQTIHCEDRRP